jgi:hypothetical protein
MIPPPERPEIYAGAVALDQAGERGVERPDAGVDAWHGFPFLWE